MGGGDVRREVKCADASDWPAKGNIRRGSVWPKSSSYTGIRPFYWSSGGGRRGREE